MSQVSVILGVDSTVTSIKGIKCEEELSCSMVIYTILNFSPNIILFEELECEERTSCMGFLLDGDRFLTSDDPSIAIGEVECEGDNACFQCIINIDDIEVACIDFVDEGDEEIEDDENGIGNTLESLDDSDDN